MKKILLCVCLVALSVNLTAFADDNYLSGKAENINKSNNINPNMYIDIVKTAIPINSKYLNKQYSGYKITITSRYPGTLNILGGQIIDGISGQQAYINTEVDCSVDACWFPLVVNKENKKSKTESYKYSSQTPTGFLNSGDSTEIYTLAPIGSSPQVKMNFIDVNNNEYFTISR